MTSQIINFDMKKLNAFYFRIIFFSVYIVLTIIIKVGVKQWHDDGDDDYDVFLLPVLCY
jgi:hypothetical protein